jgi:hypothetical protein
MNYKWAVTTEKKTSMSVITDKKIKSFDILN